MRQVLLRCMVSLTQLFTKWLQVIASAAAGCSKLRCADAPSPTSFMLPRYLLSCQAAALCLTTCVRADKGAYQRVGEATEVALRTLAEKVSPAVCTKMPAAAGFSVCSCRAMISVAAGHQEPGNHIDRCSAAVDTDTSSSCSVQPHSLGPCIPGCWTHM